MKFIAAVFVAAMATGSNAWLFSSCQGGGIDNWKKNDCHNVDADSVQFQSDNGCTIFIYGEEGCQGTAVTTKTQNTCFSSTSGHVSSVKCVEGL
ncbi:hypothetical protein K491DRAFT_692039 [Lophiostoma macrostomum CBS 122681]|uniref:Uncharacterized protein n=1 Tax=Lophiostoma macrostomum CBS 122681 TaxID=1314788 RepID=A0A6A6T9L2_9PLEO|nr:hypothetical protein K491DRAFT_692039 [Lophiostoma macrostomum CBS 122681]